MAPSILYCLYIDLEKTGQWENCGGLGEREEVQRFCKNEWIKIADLNNVLHHNNRGDDFMAWFANPHEVINTTINIQKKLQDICLRNPCPNLLILPRILAFSDDVVISGTGPDKYETLSGRKIGNIIPYERIIGQVGRIAIESRLHDFLNNNTRDKFEFHKTVTGKRKQEVDIYYSKDNIDLKGYDEEGVKYLYKYRDDLLRNLAIRNSITNYIINNFSSIDTTIGIDNFIGYILDVYRIFLDGFAYLNTSAKWNFRLSLWEPSEQHPSHLKIKNYSYPNKQECISMKREILVEMGKNIVGECYSSGEPVCIKDWKSRDKDKYPPLHANRDKNIAGLLALPIIEEINGRKTIYGVIAIDTSVDGFFNVSPENIEYHQKLGQSFVGNIFLAISRKNHIIGKMKGDITV